MGTMTGVIQNTAERDMLDDVITSYFSDTLQSFIHNFKLTRDAVCRKEDTIVKQLAVSVQCTRVLLGHMLDV